LLALTLPAVQRARESARRVHCLNNLRQQSVAIQNHVSTWIQFPSGGWGVWWLGFSDRGVGVRQPGGWIYSILPLCEQSSVHQLAPTSTTFVDAVQVRRFCNRPLAVFKCPERPYTEGGLARTDIVYPGNVSLTECAKSDYAINAGTKYIQSSRGPHDLVSADNGTYQWPDTSALDGISFLRSTIRFADITDGTSQVIAVGEKWTDGSGDVTEGNDQPLYVGDSLDIRRWGNVAPARDRHELGSELGFGSAHDAGAGFAFCDGSVKTIPYYIDPRVFQKLCSRNDGAVVGDEW
jgi:prepilin-type processing-associated H-X9-DG protein